MRTDLFLSAKRSIAFDTSVVEKLNNKAGQIDSRLYLFAYYQPKYLPDNIDARGCFNLAVLNMYGLLWDCGKMVLQQLFGHNQKPKAIKNIVDTHLEKSNEFIRIISDARAYICHNNSANLFYNKIKRDNYKQYLSKAGEQSVTSVCENLLWEKICQDFISRCDGFYQAVDDTLERIHRESDPEKKNAIVEYWINSIATWYRTDDELVAHVLADRYRQKLITGITNKKNTPITKHMVTKWIGSAWKKINRKTLASGSLKTCYINYIEECRNNIPGILNAQNCPKPALPLEILTKATIDVSRFKV